MSREKVARAVIAAIHDVMACDPESVKEESYLVSDIGTDSLDIVEIGLHIESRFDLSLDDSKMDSKVLTVKDLIDVTLDAYNNKLQHGN